MLRLCFHDVCLFLPSAFVRRAKKPTVKNETHHNKTNKLACAPSGEFIGEVDLCRPYVYMCVCVCQHFQTSLKTLGRLKPNFIWSLFGTGERKFVQTVLVIWPRWPPCPYMVKTLKIFFSGTKGPMTLKLGMQHRVLEYYQVFSNDDPGLTLTYFTARSNLVLYAFVWEKGKTMDFFQKLLWSMMSKLVDAELNDNMNIYEYQRSR